MKRIYEVWKVGKDGKETKQTIEVKKGQKVDQFGSLNQIAKLLVKKPGKYSIKEFLIVE